MELSQSIDPYVSDLILTVKPIKTLNFLSLLKIFCTKLAKMSKYGRISIHPDILRTKDIELAHFKTPQHIHCQFCSEMGWGKGTANWAVRLGLMTWVSLYGEEIASIG